MPGLGRPCFTGTELQCCGMERVLETDAVMVTRNVLYANGTVSTVTVCCEHVSIGK